MRCFSTTLGAFLGLLGGTGAVLILHQAQGHDGWQNLVPGSPYSPVVIMDVSIDLDFTCSDREADNIIWDGASSPRLLLGMSNLENCRLFIEHCKWSRKFVAHVVACGL